MFGFIGSIVDDVCDFAEEVNEDPIGAPLRKGVDMATQPLRDGLDIVDGLTEGELREKAILRLGVDVVSGMALGDLIGWYNG